MASLTHVILAPVPDSINVNFSQNTFDYAEFWRILTNKQFSEQNAQIWTQNHYYFTFQISTLYLLLIFGTKYLMKNRQPFNLFIPLNAWNLFLAVFSIICFIKTAPEFYSIIYNKGFQGISIVVPLL